MSLGSKSLKAFFWSGAESFVNFGLQFLISVLLARLLRPEDFGAIAIIYLFTGIARIFIDSGFSGALIQRQNNSPEDKSTVFFFNISIGAIVAVLLCIAAPYIALFFELPVLQPLTRLMALNLFIGSFGAIQTTLLAKELNFRTQMKISASAATISGVAAVILAWRGFGLWSLAFQIVISTVLNVVLLWWWFPWRPVMRFSIVSLRSLFRFGSFLLVAGLLDVVYTRFYFLIIGKFYSLRDLGFYTRAQNTQEMPVSMMTGILQRVSFPIFSAAASVPLQLKRGVRKVLIVMMMINIPMMAGLLVVAGPLVVTLFGEKWASCIPILQVLCLAGMLWPLHVINVSVLMAQGRSDVLLKAEVLKKVIGISVFLIACFFGVLAIAWGQVVFGIIAFFINAYFTGRSLGYGAWQQLADLLPYAMTAFFMLVCVWLIKFIAPFTPVGLLALQLATGLVIYSGTCKLLKFEAFDEVWSIVVQKAMIITKPSMPVV